MKTVLFRFVTAAMLGAVVLAVEGCCYKPECVKTVAAPPPPPPPTPVEPCGPATGELPAIPPNAKPGECYAKTYIPATYRTVTERVLVREASETIEVVPAEYEWVEERVVAKEASSALQAVPAQYAERDRTIETAPARTDWEVKASANCEVVKGQPAKDVYCLVTHPPEQKVVKERYIVKPAAVESKTIPAEYQTVKRQRVSRPATTRRVAIPAEFADVQRTVKVCDARVAWTRVPCEETGAVRSEAPRPVENKAQAAIPAPEEKQPVVQTAVKSETPAPAKKVSQADNAASTKTREFSRGTINAVKSQLRLRGYKPGPINGVLNSRDLVAINSFQKNHSLPIGNLDAETIRALRVRVR